MRSHCTLFRLRAVDSCTLDRLSTDTPCSCERDTSFPLLLSLFLLVGMLPTTTTYAQAQRISDTVSLDADGSVSIDNHEGSITVTTWDRDAVQYEVEIDAPEGSDQLRNTTIDVNHTSRSLHLATEQRDQGDDSRWFSWNNGGDIPNVHYTPSGCRARPA